MMASTKFISYKSENRPIATRIRDALRAWGYATWFDQDDIPKGVYFRDAIQAGLESADVVVGILTEAALESREVLTEWDYAFSGKARLLLLRYEDVELPYWLAGVQYIDCTGDETAALEQLRQALITPDTSKYSAESSPEYIQRHGYTKATQIYQPPEDPQDNRAKMLYNVYQTWIQGALRPNLPAGAFDLGLGLKPDAVLRHVDYDDYQLPETGRDIGQIFVDMKGELLILGAPGSGKTILLLQLAEHLLGVAQHDTTKPIPAVFNLSSWGREQKPLAEWLAEELRRGYGVPKQTGEDWVRNGKLTLLLDGLDELAPTADIMHGVDDVAMDEGAVRLRSACIDAINAYRAEHPHVDIAVCSRIKDYDVLQHKLDLNAAILLRELTDQQIAAYLAGDEHAGTRELLQHETTAGGMAKTPFLLTMMKAVYAAIPYKGSPHRQLKLDDQSERQPHLLNEYITGQLNQHEHPKYGRNDTLHYLRWLAWQMVRNKKSVFYIEDLQPDYIINRKNYALITRPVIGLLLGLILGLNSGLLILLVLGLWWGLSVGLFLGLIGGPILFSIIGLIFGLFVGLNTRLNHGLTNIKLIENTKWLWQGELIANSLIFGLSFGVIFGLIVGLSGGLIGALILGLSSMLISGLTAESGLNLRNSPNAGLTLSLKNGVIFGSLGGLIGALFGALFGGLIGGLTDGLLGGLLGGLIGGLIGVLFGGWLPVIEHITLRYILVQEGVIPRWRYDKFLDHCAEAGLLRKIGGGYIFRHRILLEHFAAQYGERSSRI